MPLAPDVQKRLLYLLQAKKKAGKKFAKKIANSPRRAEWRRAMNPSEAWTMNDERYLLELESAPKELAGDLYDGISNKMDLEEMLYSLMQKPRQSPAQRRIDELLRKSEIPF